MVVAFLVIPLAYQQLSLPLFLQKSIVILFVAGCRFWRGGGGGWMHSWWLHLHLHFSWYLCCKGNSWCHHHISPPLGFKKPTFLEIYLLQWVDFSNNTEDKSCNYSHSTWNMKESRANDATVIKRDSFDALGALLTHAAVPKFAWL